MDHYVVFILGTAWCGSSLLNLLLGTQRQICGLGEVSDFRDINRATIRCARCRSHIKHCKLANIIKPQQFYSSLFNAFPAYTVIVDSSKNWWSIGRNFVVESNIVYQAVVLSKAPHEFVASYCSRKVGTVAQGFAEWLGIYNHIFECLERYRDRGTVLPSIAESHVVPVTYRQMVRDPSGTVTYICNTLGHPCDVSLVANWHNMPNHCVIGGNPSVFDQLVGDHQRFTTQSSKYYGKMHRVFEDRSWIQNKDILRECIECYRRDDWIPHLNRLLKLLNQPNLQDLQSEVSNAIGL